MEDASMNILIGGEAGQGLVTVGQLLSKSLVRSGYEILVSQDYMSRIRGGHNTFAIRTAVEEVLAPVERIDVLVALNQETVDLHRHELAEGGLVIADKGIKTDGLNALQVPFEDLAPRPIFINVAALGVVASVLGLDRRAPAQLIAETFKKKGEQVIKENHKVLDDAWTWVDGQNGKRKELPKTQERGKRMMIDGNQAIAMGAMAAGVRFCAFYPMTPSTSIPLTLIANKDKMGIVVEQAEDEIAAINMCLGASYAGAPALAATSGGGFALMTEGVSLAGITETPIVVALAQRPGPATGLPTRTEQGDLNLVLYGGHGEFPRAVFAPGTIRQFFDSAHKAFDLAERFQVPVFVLTDQYMADSLRAETPFDLKSLPKIARPDTSDGGEDYVRYAVTESGVSPRKLPGFGRHLVVVDSDEHTADGHITESAQVRIEQNEKRLRKQCGLFKEAEAPEIVGEASPDLLLVCWGSTRGAALEAAKIMNGDGRKVAVMHFNQIWPMDASGFMHALESAREVACVEGNATGQLASLIRGQTGFAMHKLVLRYDGRPFTAKYIIDRLSAPDAPGSCK